jgi:hypothetical protein
MSTNSPPVALQFDFSGAETLLAVLDRDSISDADVDRALASPSTAAMVRNVTRFIPRVGVRDFRRDLLAFPRTKRSAGSAPDTAFMQLVKAWRTRSSVRALIDSLRADSATVRARVLAALLPYQPATGTLDIRVYFVVGGVSEGFVFDDDPRPAFYINLARAEGDYGGVVLNIAHEAYHVMQKAAQRRVTGLASVADSTDHLPPVARLLAVTLAEGVADLVADPARMSGDGPHVARARASYRQNLAPIRLAANFALFDSLVTELSSEAISWERAYERGFSGNEGSRLYFVGYHMAQALEKDGGPSAIGRLFEQQPTVFFNRYVALYRSRNDTDLHFARSTEAAIAALGSH